MSWNLHRSVASPVPKARTSGWKRHREVAVWRPLQVDLRDFPTRYVRAEHVFIEQNRFIARFFRRSSTAVQSSGT